MSTPKIPGTQRTTRQRSAILDFLNGCHEFITAKELHAELANKDISLSTIYRTVRNLVDMGELDAIVDNEGESRYRLCGKHHHHHLLCRQCGKNVEFQSAEAEEFAYRLGKSEGFTNLEHRLEIVGTCSACS